MYNLIYYTFNTIRYQDFEITKKKLRSVFYKVIFIADNGGILSLKK